MRNNFDVENFDLKNSYNILLINKIQRNGSFDVKKFDLKTRKMVKVCCTKNQNIED